MKHKKSCKQVIILFTRYPQPGKVKTRMIGQLGSQGAADLHVRMTEQVVRRIKPTLQPGEIELQIHYYGGTDPEMAAWLGKEFTYHAQQGNDLGQRMANAFKQAGRGGAKQILLIGSDCPDIDMNILLTGLKKLADHDLVLGPAADGGYYLIGLPAAGMRQANLFNNISWSTDRVLQQTIKQAENAGFSYYLLPQLHDIDRPEDLVHFNYHPGS